MSNLHEFLQAITPSLHDVRTDRRYVGASLLHRIKRWVGNEVPLKVIAYPTTQHEICEFSSRATSRARNQMIFCSHHEAVIVRFKVKAAIYAASLIALEQL